MIGRILCWLGLHRWGCYLSGQAGGWTFIEEKCRRCGALRSEQR